MTDPTMTMEEFGDLVLEQAYAAFDPDRHMPAVQRKRAQLNFYVGLVRLLVGIERGRALAPNFNRWGYVF